MPLQPGALCTRTRSLVLVTLVLSLTTPCSCRRVPEPENSQKSAPQTLGVRASLSSSSHSLSLGAPSAALPSASPRASSTASLAIAEPTVRLALPTSAYQVSLAADEDAVYVLTSDAAYRVPNVGRVQKTELDLGIGPALTRSFVLYWSKGGLWRAPKQGGKPERIATLAHQPQYFASSGDDFAWLDHDDAGKFSISTLQSKAPKLLYAAAGMIDAVTMIQGSVFFVERVAEGSWRFGRVSVTGGQLAFSATKSGRSPAMLAGTHNVTYYDGNQREVRALAADFRREETLMKDFICSPIAVAERVYCAQLQGLYELPGKGRPAQLVSESGRAPMAALVASRTHVAWLSDTGPDQLELKTLALGAARP